MCVCALQRGAFLLAVFLTKLRLVKMNCLSLTQNISEKSEKYRIREREKKLLPKSENLWKKKYRELSLNF